MRERIFAMENLGVSNDLYTLLAITTTTTTTTTTLTTKTTTTTSTKTLLAVGVNLHEICTLLQQVLALKV